MPASPMVLPGFYPGPGQAALLRPNNQQFLFQQQLVVPALARRVDGSNLSASIAVQLGRIQDGYPWGMSFQYWFTNISGVAANPGTFEIDIQTADFDNDASYVTQQSPNGGLNGDYSGRYEFPIFWAKFTRVYIKTLANTGVYCNVAVSR
jgi:hypothetical protein